MRNYLFGCLIALMCIFNCALDVPAQSLSGAQVIKVQSSLVTIPAIVSDSDGNFLSGLKKDSFALYQDGKSESISHFLTTEEPMKIALLLDASRSTTIVLKDIKKAARRFLLQMRSQDLAMVMTFDSQLQTLCPLSSDRRELREAIEGVKPSPAHTKLRDAIFEIIQKRFRSILGHKAIVLLTDGQDRGSSISEADLDNAISASSTVIYPVFYRIDQNKLYKKLTGVSTQRDLNIDPDLIKDEKRAIAYLGKISELSAGHLYQSNVAGLDHAFREISEELRYQYLIGFYPDSSKLNGEPHELELRVSIPGATVRSRKSYRAYTESTE
jgi:Ca-activated chloride channel homolog